MQLLQKILFVWISMSFSNTSPVTIIAHRGASGYEPENTLRSFTKAITMEVDMIELDVYICKSGQPVVIHDDTIDRTTNGKGRVEDLTYDQLKKYDAGKKEHIPLLRDVFDLVAKWNKNMVINIELKGNGTVKPVAELIKVYVKNGKLSYKNFIVTSFDHYKVKEFHDELPQVKTGVLFEGNPIDLADIAKKAGADYAVMYYEWLTPKFIADAHKKGVKVFVYTVNTKELAQKMQKMGADGIITDYPDILTKK